VRFKIVCAAVLSAGPALAQVGFTPERSPYKDLDRKHEFTLLVGSFSPSEDKLRIAPRGGPLTGFQYEWRALGPVHLATQFTRATSERTVINPAAVDVNDRIVGTETAPIYGLDGMMALALTGPRSWHSLVPMVSGGLGVVTNLKAADAGGFQFGTKFAFSMSGGIRWTPGGRLQLRADVTDRMYRISYPETYYIEPEGGTAVLNRVDSNSNWAHNRVFTFGLSYFAKK
jgi:hypothetical protein